PDVSLGTHFFNDLVEYDTLYVAYFPQKTGNQIDAAWFENAPNRLVECKPDAAGYADVIRVIDCPDDAAPEWLRADAAAQRAEVLTTRGAGWRTRARAEKRARNGRGYMRR